MQSIANSRNLNVLAIRKTKLWNSQTSKQLKQAFVGYADFECFLKGEMTDKSVKTGITETSRKEIKYQSHEPASYFTKLVSIDPEFDLQVY